MMMIVVTLHMNIIKANTVFQNDSKCMCLFVRFYLFIMGLFIILMTLFTCSQYDIWCVCISLLSKSCVILCLCRYVGIICWAWWQGDDGIVFQHGWPSCPHCAWVSMSDMSGQQHVRTPLCFFLGRSSYRNGISCCFNWQHWHLLRPCCVTHPTRQAPSMADSEVLCVQCILRDVASVGWKTNYLWFCREVPAGRGTMGELTWWS